MSQAELNGELFTLERFPPNAEEEALQAWEAADEYLLQQVNDVDGLTLIFNDGFGALACALAERNPVSINDSFISELATRHNLRMNGIDEESVRFQDSLSPLPAAPALVLIKVPKQLALLEAQGCHVCQGYLFSKPVPLQDFCQLLLPACERLGA